MLLRGPLRDRWGTPRRRPELELREAVECSEVAERLSDSRFIMLEDATVDMAAKP